MTGNHEEDIAKVLGIEAKFYEENGDTPISITLSPKQWGLLLRMTKCSSLQVAEKYCAIAAKKSPRAEAADYATAYLALEMIHKMP